MSLSSIFPLAVNYVVVAALLAVFITRNRALAKKAAIAQVEATRLRRRIDRLEMVLKQAEPELFAQVQARSDMEWEQTVARLDEAELPVFFPLETSFQPISPLADAQ
jgi:hypothetical protein